VVLSGDRLAAERSRTAAQSCQVSWPPVRFGLTSQVPTRPVGQKAWTRACGRVHRDKISPGEDMSARAGPDLAVSGPTWSAPPDPPVP
jgi:hypothetical protein